MIVEILITWMVMCPISNHPVVEVESTWGGTTWDATAIIECPNHHIALFAKPEFVETRRQFTWNSKFHDTAGGGYLTFEREIRSEVEARP